MHGYENPAWEKSARGFESHPLRQSKPGFDKIAAAILDARRAPEGRGPKARDNLALSATTARIDCAYPRRVLGDDGATASPFAHVLGDGTRTVLGNPK